MNLTDEIFSLMKKKEMPFKESDFDEIFLQELKKKIF